MRKRRDSKIGCILTAALFVLIAVLYSRFYSPRDIQQPESDEISWVDAVEKCKAHYRTLGSSWKVKVPNCRKRTEDESYYYFSWTRPVSIFVEEANGKKSANKGTCQVEKKSGKIVYMTFNKDVVINKIGKK